MARIDVDSLMCKGCLLCIAECPKNVLELSDKRGRAGYLLPAAVRSDDCIICRKCELICPEFAIEVTKG